MKPRSLITALSAAAVGSLLVGCSALGVSSTATSTATEDTATTQTTTTTDSSTTATTVSGEAELALEDARAANATPDEADTSWDESSAVTITLSGDTATADGDGVTVDGNTVTITAGGTYVLTGSLSGQVVVDSASDDEVKLVLSDAEITSSTTAAINFADAGEAVVVLADGTSNTLTDASAYTDTSDDAPGAALYSKADLTIGGTGSLTVVGQNLDGIAGADGVVISGGTIDVTAADDGIRGKDHLAITDGTITIDAQGDALKSTNEEETDSGFIDISGGTLTIDAGGDGFDSNGSAEITGGTVIVNGPTNDGNGALDVNGTFEVSGGTLFAVGSSGMAESPDASSSQSFVQATVSGSAGSTITISDGSTVLAEMTATKSFSNVVYSGEGIVSGSDYTITVDGQSTTVTAGTATAGGMGGGMGGDSGGRPGGGGRP